MSVTIRIISQRDFARVLESKLSVIERQQLVADMARYNALAAVKRAGSGHLGSSFSAMEIVTHLYTQRMNTLRVGFDHPERDVYFSSKGHDVPGLYALLYGLGKVPRDRLLKLRRMGGLDGHPSVGMPGIEANTGSLGMGISKGRGIAWAKRHLGRGGSVYVMVGDGELQEGQNYEALHSTVHQGIGNLFVIMDHNKVQSDQLIDQIMPLGDLQTILKANGWQVVRCDGHDLAGVAAALDEVRAQGPGPCFVIADTIKGRGVSFMEHPTALGEGGGYYRWHAGAPPDEAFGRAAEELITRINERLRGAGLPLVEPELADPEQAAPAGPANSLMGEPESVGAGRLKDRAEFVAQAYGDALVEIGARRTDLVVLDADLSADCKTRGFELTYPDRFIQNGIAEQDMVSMAAGLARHGLLPVVNSFASFLCARANEQIYNACGEGARILYACHYAGVIPAGPGRSHQSIRDISLLGALPSMVILQPCNALETRLVLEHAVERGRDNVAIRLAIGPSPRSIELPKDYVLQEGRGVRLTEGDDALLFAYGPVMLHEALGAAERLRSRGIALGVINMPWLNRCDEAWLRDTTRGRKVLAILDDHSPVGGLGDALLNALVRAGEPVTGRVHKFGVEGEPACGSPVEALAFHRLDAAALAERIVAALG